MKYQRKNTKKKYLYILLALLLVAGSVYGYTQLAGQSSEQVPVSDPDFSDGTDREPHSSPERNGGVIDTSEEDTNQEPDNTEENDGLVSDEGDITLIEPKENTLLESGSTIEGRANVERVHYRLIDDNIGVVATGSISVVDGKFSGIFEFDSNGTEGRLDIFSELESGAETNVIEVPVKLQ